MADSSGTTGHSLTVCLFHAGDPPYLTYPATVLSDDGDHVVVRALWAEPAARDVGYVTFEHGDLWTEHYWRNRWYAIKEIRHRTGRRKGWYCDVARPARVDEDRLLSEDLYLDLWVSADGTTVLRLDEEEFAASGLRTRDPVAAAAAERALEELERLARQGF
jgi:predicted RNA-binding protein associated with RNAse of E/G family